MTYFLAVAVVGMAGPTFILGFAIGYWWGHKG